MKTAILFCVAALWCVPCLAKEQSADERLRAIYTEEWKWRLEQFPGLEGVEKPVPERLPTTSIGWMTLLISGSLFAGAGMLLRRAFAS